MPKLPGCWLELEGFLLVVVVADEVEHADNIRTSAAAIPQIEAV